MPRWFHAAPARGAFFCVVGSPIRHSRSPQIHAAFARQFDIDLVYERIEVRAGELAAAVGEFRDLGGRGMNVTVPLKEEAWALATQRTDRAAKAGAANTLWFEHDEVAVDNTDGAGLVRDLEHNHGLRLEGRRILLLGAGGAARGVLPALLERGPAALAISNRGMARASALVAAFGAGEALSVLPWGEAPAQAPDLVINATSLSLQGEVPPLPAAAVGAGTVCYDMVYARDGTSFTRWAQACRARLALDGLGMLVEQAAEAFRIWHGVIPRTTELIAQLRLAD